MKIAALRKPFVLLLTVPAGIALAIGAIPFASVLLEKEFADGALSPYVLQFDVASARTMLSVVATGAMTALSLAYSLVLVVFTLAAGNIGPRLLKRFTGEIVNQITAGILGGTFLYALATLLFTQPDFVPKITIAGSGFLAVVSVLQLIYFVRHVSQSVTIDEEIAEIAKSVTEMLIERKNKNGSSGKLPADSAFKSTTMAGQPGYVGWIDTDQLVRVAREKTMVLKLGKARGEFILSDEPLIHSTHKVDETTAEEMIGYINIDQSRSEDRSIEFSVNLLVEIALRALSPGVNDTYTALAVADSLSNAFSNIAEEDTSPITLCDEDGALRLILPGLSMKYLVGQAFHPLRRAAGNNILMAQGLARVFARLYQTGGKEMRMVVEKHIELLLRELERANHLAVDIDSVTERLPTDLRKKTVRSTGKT